MQRDLDMIQINEWKEAGKSNRWIAKQLDIDESVIRRRLAKPMVPTTPEAAHESAPAGFRVRGVSTLYGKDGDVKQQWVKTWETDLWERINAAARAMAEKLEPLEPTLAPTFTNRDLVNLYTLTDCHVGALCWSRETGERWDLDLAEETLVKVFTKMIAAAPVAHVGIVNQLGDFLHFDSLVPLTPTNHNMLDADSRYQKVVEVAVRVLRRIIDAALAKHPVVQVYMHEGNHDPAGSVWLRVMLAALYERETRVQVGKSPLPYVAYEMGNTALFFHHGHMAKKESLPLLFAARFAEIWGRTIKRYIHTGHQHHVDEKEHPGIKVIQHPTLAAADAFAARNGYFSERQATCMTYHRKFGEVGRMVWVPEIVELESRRHDL
jgi:hypothetical protein